MEVKYRNRPQRHSLHTVVRSYMGNRGAASVFFPGCRRHCENGKGSLVDPTLQNLVGIQLYKVEMERWEERRYFLGVFAVAQEGPRFARKKPKIRISRPSNFAGRILNVTRYPLKNWNFVRTTTFLYCLNHYLFYCLNHTPFFQHFGCGCPSRYKKLWGNN